MNKYKSLLTAVLFVTLTLMMGCGSGDEDSTNGVITDKVVNTQASATASALSDAAALTVTSDDLSKSKGTDQDVIVSLTPVPAQTDVWNNVKIEVSFNVPLDASSVQKNNIKLTHLS
ncbi:MAG: hypothetical protein ABFR02_03605, partial [Campylobacterota bacterium]